MTAATLDAATKAIAKPHGAVVFGPWEAGTLGEPAFAFPIQLDARLEVSNAYLTAADVHDADGMSAPALAQLVKSRIDAEVDEQLAKIGKP